MWRFTDSIPRQMNVRRFAWLLVIVGTRLLLADDAGELYTCTFLAHTPAGTLSGTCTTQSLPDADSVSRWRMTLTFDPASAERALQLKPDLFFDMVRSQCLADGSFTTVLPLWGDIVLTPNDSDYLASNMACAPVAQTVPSRITFAKMAGLPLTFAFLLDERRADFNPALGFPTFEWLTHYLESFRRLSGNSSAAEQQLQRLWSKPRSPG